MPRLLGIAAPFAALALAACAVPPPIGPTVVAMPSKGRSFEAFQADDAACKRFASAQIGDEAQADAATRNAVGTALIGAVLAGAEGAAIGGALGNPATGAAIGAASGFFLGGEAGLAAAPPSGGPPQLRYDIGYVQCMAAKGEDVPTHFVPFRYYREWPIPADFLVGGYFY
jgi:hypothetical protein